MQVPARRFCLPGIAALALGLWAVTLLGQNAPLVNITPHTTTMQVGDSRPFRLVDRDGHMQTGVTWTISDPGALEAEGGDEVTLTAKQPGEFHLSARSAAGGDEISVKVIEGAVPAGTVIWSGPVVPGCKPKGITQAVPTANGPDLYEETTCEDGDYVTAYTAEGIQLWRRNISHLLGPSIAAANAIVQNEIAAKPLNIHSASICDLVSPGTEQQKIRVLFEQRHLSFTEDAGGRVWTVEEKGTECRLWFDEKAVLTRKRKTLVSE